MAMSGTAILMRQGIRTLAGIACTGQAKLHGGSGPWALPHSSGLLEVAPTSQDSAARW
jgi:hypothetical protein